MDLRGSALQHFTLSHTTPHHTTTTEPQDLTVTKSHSDIGSVSVTIRGCFTTVMVLLMTLLSETVMLPWFCWSMSVAVSKHVAVHVTDQVTVTVLLTMIT